MNFEEAIEYIKCVSALGTLPGLERIKYLLEKLGNPEKSLKIVHVAGTNGKGSFSSMLSSVLTEAGYNVGLFTSPHMLKYNERIKYNGVDISDDDISRLLEPIVKIAKGMEASPSEFEVTTALCYLYFSEKKPDICIIECGMGGRWDATNVIDKPLLSVITGIALDHVAYLGDTVEKIALEKSGIIKNGCPVIYGGDSDSAFEVIRNCSDNLNSNVTRTARNEIKNTRFSDVQTEFDYMEYKNVVLSLLGHYQVYNASNVIEAVKILRKYMPISDAALYNGLKNAEWIGRFEKVSVSPLVFFDGGHNPEGVNETVLSVKKIFGDKKINIVSGVLADKDYYAVAKTISEIAGRVYTVTPDSPRALSSEKYAEVFRSYGIDATPFSTFGDAVKEAYFDSKKTGTPLLCVGSLYSYSDFMKYINDLSKNG